MSKTSEESLKRIKETLKKLIKICKKRNLMTMRLKSMKYCTRKKRKSMNLCKVLRMRKLLMSNRLLLTNLLQLNIQSICRKIWPDKINYPQLLSSVTIRMSQPSNKANQKMRRIHMLDLKQNQSKDRMTQRKSRLQKVELKRKCSR